MALNLDIVINTPDDSVDMKSGLNTMQGVSDAARFIAETVLTGKAPQRQTHKKKVRTTLKKTFKGSYGHIFSIDIYDEKLKKKFNSIGKVVFSQVVSYFLTESLYQESHPMSAKAKKIVEDLGNEAEDLVKQLRKSALDNVHQVSSKFGYDVKVRFRKSRNEQTILGQFNRSTAEVLTAEVSSEEYEITAGITRFNINTGNGRLMLPDAEETVAFGFKSPYKMLTFKAKKVFSENLDHNNGIDPIFWKYLKLRVTPMKLRDGTIIKYIVKGYHVEG